MDEREGMSSYLQKIAATMLTLENDSYEIFKAIIDRDDNIQAEKRYFFTASHAMRANLDSLGSELDQCRLKIERLTELFKTILKTDRFTKFQEGVEAIPFEFFITEREMEKLTK